MASVSRTHLAVAIAAPDTPAALAAAESVAGLATLVEYRLDLMADFDLTALVEDSPLPAIITCRSPNQGGSFRGSASERRAILHHAVALGASYVDAEAEDLAVLAAIPRRRTRLIGSRHDFSGMLGDWRSQELALRSRGADIVKLVGAASGPDDVLTPLAWLSSLHRSAPGIGIAMGSHGAPSRLLAPRFAAAFLSFAATAGGGTAPGQITAEAMASDYGFAQIAAADPCIVLVCPPEVPWSVVETCRQAFALSHRFNDGWLLPVPVASFGAGLAIACRLAGVAGIVALPEVPKERALDEVGLVSGAAAWWAPRTRRRPSRSARVLAGHWRSLRSSNMAPPELVSSLLTYI